MESVLIHYHQFIVIETVTMKTIKILTLKINTCVHNERSNEFGMFDAKAG